MSIGSRIADIRQSRNLSVHELAKLVDVRPQFILSIEDGVAKAHTFTYRKIADALNVPLEMLLDENYKPPEAKNWRQEFPEDYRSIISFTMRLIVALGTLWLILVVILMFSLLVQQLGLLHHKSEQTLEHPRLTLRLE